MHVLDYSGSGGGSRWGHFRGCRLFLFHQSCGLSAASRCIPSRHSSIQHYLRLHERLCQPKDPGQEHEQKCETTSNTAIDQLNNASSMLHEHYQNQRGENRPAGANPPGGQPPSHGHPQQPFRQIPLAQVYSTPEEAMEALDTSIAPPAMQALSALGGSVPSHPSVRSSARRSNQEIYGEIQHLLAYALVRKSGGTQTTSRSWNTTSTTMSRHARPAIYVSS